jgi:hypothetical protein
MVLCATADRPAASGSAASIATTLYIGNAPKRVIRTKIKVASGASAPAASAAMPG